MQRHPFSLKIYRLSAIFLIAAVGLSACQSLGLQVEQVSATEKLLSVRAPSCDYGGRIKAIEALDENTVRFTLCTPDPAFLTKLAHPVFAIQDHGYMNAKSGGSTQMSKEPNGTGPYRLKSYSPGTQVELELNPDYWGVPAKSSTLIFRWASAPSTRLSKIQNDETDISDRPEPSSFDSIRSDPSLSLVYRPAMNVSYLGMNNQIAPFDNEKVRQALSMLLDRQKIVNENYPLGSTVANQFIPPAMVLGYTPGYRWLDYNPKAGTDLLKQVGFDFNQTLDLVYANVPTDSLPVPSQIAQEIKTQLALAGIKVNLVHLEPKDFEVELAEGNVAFFLRGWSADFPDPSNFFDSVYNAESKAFGNVFSDIDFMAKGAASIPDPVERQSRYNRINELIRLHVPAIPLVHGNTAIVMRQNVQGLAVGPLNENIEEVTLPEDTLRFLQINAPPSLWPGDETDVDTLRITRLLYDTLVKYETGGTEIKPSLAEYWEANPEKTVWTFKLRYGVKFSNGAILNANDVVITFAALWDAKSPNHHGRTGQFKIFKNFFGAFLNEPKK